MLNQEINKTLQIIKYFSKENPDLKWVIENPHGTMWKMPRMKKLKRATTLYCLYGDKRYKPTDFFNNFDLQLKECNKCKCKNKLIKIIDIPLTERYKIPSQLVKEILSQA